MHSILLVDKIKYEISYFGYFYRLNPLFTWCFPAYVWNILLKMSRTLPCCWVRFGGTTVLLYCSECSKSWYLKVYREGLCRCKLKSSFLIFCGVLIKFYRPSFIVFLPVSLVFRYGAALRSGWHITRQRSPLDLCVCWRLSNVGPNVRTYSTKFRYLISGCVTQ